jgi:hypothetical protein
MGKANVARPLTHKAEAVRRAMDADPGYIALRLRGLARLIDSAGSAEGSWEPIDGDAAFFIATELQDMADRLEPGRPRSA